MRWSPWSRRRRVPRHHDESNLRDAVALITARASADAYAWSIAVAALPSGLGIHRLTEALLCVTSMIAVLTSVRAGRHPSELLMGMYSAEDRGADVPVRRRAIALTNAWMSAKDGFDDAAFGRSAHQTAALNVALVDVAASLANADLRGEPATSPALATVALALQCEKPRPYPDSAEC